MMTGRLRAGLFFVVPMMFMDLGISSCGDDNNDPITPRDTTAPGAMQNLASGTLTANSIQLTWTATGNDGATGTADKYDIRYSPEAITAANFGAATVVSGIPTPGASGTAQNVTVSG